MRIQRLEGIQARSGQLVGISSKQVRGEAERPDTVAGCMMKLQDEIGMAGADDCRYTDAGPGMDFEIACRRKSLNRLFLKPLHRVRRMRARSPFRVACS